MTDVGYKAETVGIAPKLSLFAAVSLAIAAILPTPAGARGFTTCQQIHQYLNAPPPAEQYARINDLGNAQQLIERLLNGDSDDCEDHIVERTLFEYGSELDAYSQTFGNPQAQRTWARRAAAAFQQYLEWFVSLPNADRDRMIRVLLRLRSASEADFAPERRKWLRRRVGNALNTLGAAHVRAHQHEQVLVSYEKHSQDSIEIFPNEVVRKWHKWLRSKPDFQRDKKEVEIRKLIANDADVEAQWSAFSEFLQQFINANPSVIGEWKKVRSRINLWLSEPPSS